MEVKAYLKANLIKSLIGLIGVILSLPYVLACLLLTVHTAMEPFSSTPVLSLIAELPNQAYQKTSFFPFTLAWQNAVAMPSPGADDLNNFIPIFLSLTVLGISLGLLSRYPNARSTIARYKREAKQERLKRNVNEDEGNVDAPSETKRLEILIQNEKSWISSWWGKLFLTIIGGLLLAMIVSFLGLK